MTPSEFRRIALSLANAVEGAHMGHADFRVSGKIFATLSYPDKNCGMVVLSPDQQQEYVQKDPDTFVPASGAWGRAGCTIVRLGSVDEETIGEAMTLAWQNALQKIKASQLKTKRRRSTRSRASKPRARREPRTHAKPRERRTGTRNKRT